MSASDNTLRPPGLLSARNVILAAAAILVISIVGMCWSMLRPHDSGGVGRDSYGTRSAGYRALYELLGELGVPVQRDMAPPRADMNTQSTLALIAPNPQLVGSGPKYVQALDVFVENGGMLVVALPAEGSGSSRQFFLGREVEGKSRDILELLGIEDQLQRQQGAETSTEEDIFTVTCTGSLASLSPLLWTVAVPGSELVTLSADASDLAGSMTGRGTDGTEYLLAAAVRRGEGEIVVFSDPRILSNKHLGRADNAILALHLLARQGRNVIFDEFYHGLAVRGNPLYLLTRPGFAAVSIGIVAFLGIWTWRQAVFLGPPLPEREPSRRDIAEYVDAMGAFFCRGRGHRAFLIREVRDGVLHRLCDELRLPSDTTDVAVIEAGLRRRNGALAEALGKRVRDIDATLASSGDYPAAKFLDAVHELSDVVTRGVSQRDKRRQHRAPTLS
jgi:hypothetical protein